ncbi:MAG: hypothetical protein AMXMBFR16_09060 [Candidatus Uhrbacteria bacterium]
MVGAAEGELCGAASRILFAFHPDGAKEFRFQALLASADTDLEMSDGRPEFRNIAQRRDDAVI